MCIGFICLTSLRGFKNVPKTTPKNTALIYAGKLSKVKLNMKVKINDNLFDVKTVLTSKDAQQGMMGKKFDKTFLA